MLTTVIQEINDEMITLRSSQEIWSLKLSEVLWVQSWKDYILLNTKIKNYLIRFPFGSLEKHFPTSQFNKVHKSFLVNTELNPIQNGNSYYVGDTVVPMGRSLANFAL